MMCPRKLSSFNWDVVLKGQGHSFDEMVELHLGDSHEMAISNQGGIQ